MMFHRNLIKGPFKSDIAILFVSSIVGEFEMSVSKDQEYVSLVYTLGGIKKIIVVVNKMDDKTVNYSENRFDFIQTEMNNILSSVEFEDVTILPVFGWTGENIFEKSSKMERFNID